MTRTAAADEALWSEILRANRQPVADALRALSSELAGLADAIAADDRADVAATWRAGADARERATSIRWGEPSWNAERFALPAWDALLELGREGRAVRRPRVEGDVLALDVAALTA